MMIRRRTALLGLSSSWMLGRSSLALAASSGRADDPRFVVVLLRGALDGMAAVTPYGDPDLAGHRAALLLPEPGQAKGLLDLGGFYGLHPSLSGMHELYAAGQLLPIHAVAGHYRSRSHFDAQDYLESGADQRLTSGWLNRAVAAMPQQGARPDGFGLAMGLTVPLLLRGPARVGSYAPEGSQHPDAALYSQIAALNAGDAVTGPAFRDALRARGFSDAVLDASAQMPAGYAASATMQTAMTAGSGNAMRHAAMSGSMNPGMGNAMNDGADHGMNAGAAPHMTGAGKPKMDGFTTLAAAAGQMLADPHGPRVAALEIGGWDTHAGQVGRLNAVLAQLDRGIMALRENLGPAWSRTAVLVMTEFGRTVRVNGTGGTDHGTGTVTFVAGGPIAGGRVGGTWPGLKPSQLFENRDVAPMTDLRAVASGLLSDHMGLSSTALAQVFPGPRVDPVRGLLRVA